MREQLLSLIESQNKKSKMFTETQDLKKIMSPSSWYSWQNLPDHIVGDILVMIGTPVLKPPSD